MSASYDVRQVEYVGGHRLRLTFVDDLVGEVDLSARLMGEVGPMFEPLKDPDFFAQVSVDREVGTIVWLNGADLAPEALHERARQGE